jgi:tight adherence protein B
MLETLLASDLLIPAIGSLSAFVIIMFVFVVLARSIGRDDGVSDRLSQYGGRTISAAPQQPSFAQRMDEVVAKGERGNKIARDLARADLKLTVSEFIGLKILAALAGAGLGAVAGRAAPSALIISALVGALVFSFIPNIYVALRARARVRAFNNQLGDTINMLANSLRSGYSLLQSMELVSREAPPPVSQEFRRVVQEVGLGLTTEQALGNLLRRVPSDDLDLMVTAVNIQHEVGGNLAQILETIGHTIRERIRIKGEIRVLTAQGRISAYVITALPLVLAIVISVINPNYMAPIFTFGLPPQAWCCLPVTSAIMMAIGFWAIMKIVDIEV